MARHIIQAADGTRHIIEVPDAPVAQTGGSTAAQRAELRVSAEKAAQDRELADEYSGAKGLLANVGAGMDNTVQGVKSLFGFGKDDAAIAEERAIKKKLGDSTMGGGVAQFAGEAASQLPLVMAGGAGVAGAATKVAPKAVALARTMGGRIVNAASVGRSAAEGAISGAIPETTTDESKGANVALGAALGGALPAVVSVGSKLSRTMSKKYAPERAAKMFDEHLGPDNMTQINDVIDSPATSMLPLSTAAKAQNVPLASLERGARKRGDWAFEHDKPVEDKARELLQGATKDADELTGRVSDRELMMRESKANLNAFDDPTKLRRASNDASDAIQALRETPTVRQNPDLSNMLGQTEMMLKHPDRTAADYASQYWRLSHMLDDAKLSAESRDVIMKLRDVVASAGDTTAGGSHFSDMLGRYMAEEAHVGQAKSAQAIREFFQTPQGVPKAELGSNQLRSALAQHGEGQHGSTIADTARQELNALEKELGRHELWQAKNSPGPSNAGDPASPVAALGSGANNPFNRVWALRGLSNLVLGGSRKATVQAADEALQSPEAWKKMMEAYAKSKSPLTPQEYAERIRRSLLNVPGRSATIGATQGE